MKHRSDSNSKRFRFTSKSGAAALSVLAALVFPASPFFLCEGNDRIPTDDKRQSGQVEQVKVATAPSDAPAAEKKKIRGTAADLLPKIKPEGSPYVPKSE